MVCSINKNHFNNSTQHEVRDEGRASNDPPLPTRCGPTNGKEEVEREGNRQADNSGESDVERLETQDETKNTGSLTIRNTRIRHSGQYKLSISTEQTKTKIFHVTVVGAVDETDGMKSVSVMEGDSVTLHTDAEIHTDDLIVWRFGDKGVLLAKLDVETNETSLNDADSIFKDRLQLNQTGSLTITNTRTEHTGLYEVQIRAHESSQRFLLSVT
ncbi:uncharacterized protein LOC107745733, partial [Sinocyclocheilus rhinocerous]|uniref:uncharacterized protein LOC107745733 n=1 Tax=Sinocyclocheilus rhinocerous TaxID=307959 RepID=UPI0007BABEBE